MSSCQSCGTAIADDTRFCQSCGSPTELRPGVSMPAVEGSAAVGVMSPSAETGSKTMDTNVVGALTYVAGFITGIVFLVLDPYKSNSFVRFHAFQSIFFNVAWVAFWIVWMILSAVLTPLTAGIFGLIALPLMLHFRSRRLWNLDLPDASGLSAKTFQAADRWQIRRRASGRKAVMSDSSLTR